MSQLLSILMVAIALSMDTFSLSLSMGMFNVSRGKALRLSLIVGIMHFVMPFIGMILGDKLVQIFEIKGDLLLGIILIFIAMQMIIDILKKEEEKFNLSFLGMFIFAFGVSLDSFTVGLGIKALTENIYLAMSIFAVVSASFTFGGLFIGTYANKLLGVYANIIGAIVLFVLGILHIL